MKENRQIRYGDGYINIRHTKSGQPRAQARWSERHPLKGTVWRAKTFPGTSEREAVERAQDHLRAIGRLKDRGEFVPEVQITLTEAMLSLAEQRLEHGRWSPGTYASNKILVRRIVEPDLGRHQVTRITPRMMQAWVDRLVRTYLSGSTIANVVSLVRATLNQLVQQGVINTNPATHLEVGKKSRQREDSWTLEQVQAIVTATASNPKMRAFYLLGFSTGMRPGELRALRWPDIDINAATVTVRSSIAKDANQVEYVSPKTKSRKERILAIGTTVIDALSAWKAKQNQLRLQSGEWLDTIVFDRGDGRFTPAATMLKAHYQVLDTAGLPKEARYPMHVIRHTYATLEAAANTHPSVVQMRMGHATPEFTLRRYTHPTTDMQKAAAELMAQQLLSPPADATTSGKESSISG